MAIGGLERLRTRQGLAETTITVTRAVILHAVRRTLQSGDNTPISKKQKLRIMLAEGHHGAEL